MVRKSVLNNYEKKLVQKHEQKGGDSTKLSITKNFALWAASSMQSNVPILPGWMGIGSSFISLSRTRHPAGYCSRRNSSHSFLIISNLPSPCPARGRSTPAHGGSSAPPQKSPGHCESFPFACDPGRTPALHSLPGGSRLWQCRLS